MLAQRFHYADDPDKIMRAALFCSNFDRCGHADFAPYIERMAGHGDTCRKCAIGMMRTHEFPSKKRPGTLVRGLFCSNRPGCEHAIFDSMLPPIEGDGKICPVCEIGRMRTKEKRLGSKSFPLLACDAYPACKHGEWPSVQAVPAFQGEAPEA